MTPLQKRALAFVADFIEEAGYSPSFSEIMTGLDLKSKGNVARLVDGLVEQGRLIKHPGRSRSLELPDFDLLRVPTSKLWAELERRGAARG
jgi:repressor LexA